MKTAKGALIAVLMFLLIPLPVLANAHWRSGGGFSLEMGGIALP